MGPVIGIAGGLAARRMEEIRWEDFDDEREMKRHKFGAAMMGMDGILAGGCTISQGLSAGSCLSLPLATAIISIVVDARSGIHTLMQTRY